jgi:DNA-binding transcriptional ArsR family regulator
VQDVIEAVASPRRREILRLVWDDERSAGEIAARFDVSWPAISQNIAVLRRAGLLVERREGNRRYYRADRGGLGSLEAVLREMWAHELEELDAALERERRG